MRRYWRLELELFDRTTCETFLEYWYHLDITCQNGFTSDQSIQGATYDRLNLFTGEWLQDSLEVGILWDTEIGLVRHYKYDVTKNEAVLIELLAE